MSRFSGPLITCAGFRLRPAPRPLYDPEDLVNEAWAVALPRLSTLPSREGRMTPVLLRFLTTTILHRTMNLVNRHIRSGGAPRKLEPDAGDPRLSQLPAGSESVVSSAVRRETQGHVLEALDALDPNDREILLLRGIEQVANQTVSILLGLTPQAGAMRYQRALERLKLHLPDSIFGEIED